MLRTKSILTPIAPEDGTRISVMSRHTLNDGITPHPQITSASYDEWLKILAPPAKLVGDYYKRGLAWNEFEERYCSYLKKASVAPYVHELSQTSLESTVTILCIEGTPDLCHRRLLAERCKLLTPELEVYLR